MDINATLKDLRTAIAEFYRLQEEGTPDGDARALELASDVTAMVDCIDEWLSKGDDLPSAWSHRRSPVRPPVE